MSKRKQKVNKGTLRRVLELIRPYAGLVVLTLVLAVVTVVTTLLAPVISGKAVDHIIGPGQVDFGGVGKLAIAMAGTVACTAVSQWLMNVVNNRITFHVVRDMRVRAFEQLEQLPLKYMDAHRPGDAISRITTDVEQFSDGLLLGFTQLFTGILTICGTLGVMLFIEWRIALVVVALTPLSIFVARFIATHTYSMFKVQSETRAELTSLVDELVGNEHLVRAFGYESRAEERFDKINLDLQSCGVRAVFFSSMTNPCTRFVNALVYAAVGVLGAFAAIAGGITVGDLSVFLNYANQYTKPFNEVTNVITQIQTAYASARRMFALLDAREQEPDAADAVELVAPQGEVTFEHVDFSYVPDRKLLQDICIEAKPGTRFALVGPTGCGKTTLINLLLRFYDIDAGRIMVDGKSSRDYTRASLRRAFGMVLQDTWLFEGTVAENIAYGCPDATREQVIEAAKRAHAHKFIVQLPGGYDTVIGEDGGTFSQGQKQLLCIARVMLTDPAILLLDEATSSIDTRTELQVQAAFDELMAGRTSFVVAHRLSTIRNADCILVMRDGEIIERGTHDELLAAGGFYAELYRSQFAQ